MRLSSLTFTVTAAVLFSGSAFAANTIFVSEVDFLSAAGATQIESFESNSGSNRDSAPILTSLFTVTPIAAYINIQYNANAPESGFGAFPVSGNNYLLSWNPGQPSGTLHFALANPSTVFALTLTDAGEAPGAITIRTGAGFYSGSDYSLPIVGGGDGSTLFYGLTQDIAFNDVYLTVDGVDDAFGVDKVHVAPVPEPAESALILAGLALFFCAGQRRANSVSLSV